VTGERPTGDEHVDPMSEVEAEFEAEASELDQDLAHLVHPHHGPDREAGRGGAGPAVAPDTIGTEPPPNRRADRQRFLVVYLRVALVAAFVIGVLELVLPVDARDEAAVVMVAVFVAAPIGRVVWLMVRWLRRGDWRFALVGAALLAVVATGFLAR
jgi:hypothetical protein